MPHSFPPDPVDLELALMPIREMYWEEYRRGFREGVEKFKAEQKEAEQSAISEKGNIVLHKPSEVQP